MKSQKNLILHLTMISFALNVLSIFLTFVPRLQTQKHDLSLKRMDYPENSTFVLQEKAVESQKRLLVYNPECLENVRV